MARFTEDLGFPEAPVILPDGGFLVVEMMPEKGCITKISADGKSKAIIARTGRPNGLALDREGRVWIAETAQRALLKMDLNGECQVVARECSGEPFLFLNDLAISPSGDIFLTDSGILMETIAPGGELNPDYRNLTYDGRVFKIDTETAEVACIDRGLMFTNGLAFGPDGNLYVNETLTGNIYRYACKGGEVTGERELFGNVIEDFNPAELKGPDGMKFGADGNLYVCVFGQGDVTVLDRHGAVVNRIKTEGLLPSNLAFGADGERAIYVTEVETGTLQKLDVDTSGFPLYI